MDKPAFPSKPFQLSNYCPKCGTGHIELETNVPTQPFRALRLWHWMNAKRASHHINDGRTSPSKRSDYQSEYNLHMKAVQTLNDLFPLGDTAEKDERVRRS